VVKALVHYGAKVESRIRTGPQALHLAAEAGHSETVAALLEVHIKISSARTTRRARTRTRTHVRCGYDRGDRDGCSSCISELMREIITYDVCPPRPAPPLQSVTHNDMNMIAPLISCRCAEST
jgi:hypothetical protein